MPPRETVRSISRAVPGSAGSSGDGPAGRAADGDERG